ncbi:MAG: DUF485 domain-containing protein [Planctomycetales bacterium]|nr:DUF485 domain-containing protein [Planctomycetales bacterium]
MTNPTSSRSARLGLRLFFVYLALYVAFVLANAFAPSRMEATPVAGVNLAVLSGFGLILCAFGMAAYYGWACRETSGAGRGTAPRDDFKHASENRPAAGEGDAS